MLPLHPFANTRGEQHIRELKYAKAIAERQSKFFPPSFSFGTNEIVSGSQPEDKERFRKFVGDWFSEPSRYLSHKNYEIPEVWGENQIFSFPSFIDKKDEARFFESHQPFWRRSTNTAFIVIPHWNAYFWKYRLGTAFIRDVFLPVATYRYFPKFTTEAHYNGVARFDVVGPNLGLTLKRFWQDVLNIQFFGSYLKKNLGYEHVGIWSYSIGSPRGMLASLFSDSFDFLIMNFLADSFPEAVLKGISTESIARELQKNVTVEELEYLWGPLSPGKYENYLSKLPQHTRLVQPQYDLVFGEENNARMVKKMRAHHPAANIEFGEFGHLTAKELDKVLPVISRTSSFVLKNLKQ